MLQNGRGPESSILNRHPSLLQGPALLHDLVRVTSDRPAIDFWQNGLQQQELSYADLHSLSSHLAHRILSVLTNLESTSNIIPVLLPQTPELYLVLLAILKAGKAFCPLALDTPAERLQFILRDLSAGLIISTSAHDAYLTSTLDAHVLLADLELLEPDRDPPSYLPLVHTEDAAYVLYTSGSTGLPKAVSVSHRAITQSLLAHDRQIPQFARFLQFASPTFDVSIFEIFFTWFRGRTIVGCTREQMLDDLPGTINKLRVDAVELTPTIVSNLLRGRSSVPNLKLLLTIGEMLNQLIIDEYGGSEDRESILWAMYGPTEAAVHCTLMPRVSSSSAVGTIGSPLDTVTILIVAETRHDEPQTFFDILPKGKAGELVIAGPQIATKYLNRPELTAASFVNHDDYGYMYRSGDLARICSDNSLEILGRLNAGQIKLRGQRVELGEIESVVLKVRGCRAATVILIDEVLVVFCVTEARAISRDDILDACSRWLPKFMIPSDVHFSLCFPQLPSGKVDKKALESDYLQTFSRHSSCMTNKDDCVAQTVLRILNQHNKRYIAIDSCLPSVGLDSIQCIRVASALRQEGYNIGATDVVKATTVKQLIRICKNCSLADNVHRPLDVLESFSIETSIPHLECMRADIVDIIRCTPLQEAMLAETMARPGAYCNWIEVEILGSYNFDGIRNSLSALVQANEILRTGFHSVSIQGAAFVQVIWNDLTGSQLQDVLKFSKDNSLGSDKELLRPLSIQVIVSPEKTNILFKLHHAAYDGWSFDLLLHDLARLLQNVKLAHRPQYREIAHYWTRQASSPQNAESKDYWARLLRDYVPLKAVNYTGKVDRSCVIRTFSCRSGICPDSLSRRAQELQIHPQVFYQAATAYIWSLYLECTDVVLGNVSSGRTIPVTGIEDIVGPFAVALPYRLDFQKFSRVSEFLLHTQVLNRESLPHCSVPLREIVKSASLPAGARLFEVLFVWQQSPVSNTDPSDIVQTVDSKDDLEFKITLEFEPHIEFVGSRATYDASVFPEHQVKHLLRQVDDLVGLFVKDTDCIVSDIGMCFTAESRSIANPDPDQPTFQNGPAYMVEHWASRTPDKEAIVFGQVVDGSIRMEKSISYADLNARANQVARLLSRHGVVANQLVGVIMEKSVNLYVAILAILKLGSGYLPLVPDTPFDRIMMILKDAQVSVCISQESVISHLESKSSAVFLDLRSCDFKSFSTQNVEVPYHGSHIAYAVFTSGSTGTPKGVLVTQDNLMSNLSYLASIYPHSTKSRMLQACSQAFDVSVFEIFFSWNVGMCLCVMTRDDMFRDLQAAINELKITHLSLTPTTAALVAPINVPGVEFLVTSGEALTEPVRRNWAGRGLHQGKLKSVFTHC